MDNPNLYIFIKRTIKKGNHPEAVLPSRGSFHHFIRKFLKKNNLPPIDVHGFRRMGASYSVNNQVPLTTVQTMLGHKSLSITIIYLRTLNNSRKEGAEALSNTYKQLMEKQKDNKSEDTPLQSKIPDSNFMESGILFLVIPGRFELPAYRLGGGWHGLSVIFIIIFYIYLTQYPCCFQMF